MSHRSWVRSPQGALPANCCAKTEGTVHSFAREEGVEKKSEREREKRKRERERKRERKRERESKKKRKHNAKTVCPSGLRGWTQVPLAKAAWVQIPQLSILLAARYPHGKVCIGQLTAKGSNDSAGDSVWMEKANMNKAPTVGLEPTTTRLRALRSTD